MTSWPDLNAAVALPWTGIYLRVLAVILAYGALVHVGNMLGLPGTPWCDTLLLWRVMDVGLLMFNVVVAIGLWTKASWSVVAYVAGILVLQVVPYTILRAQFIRSPADASALNGLLGTHVLLFAVLFTLIMVRR